MTYCWNSCDGVVNPDCEAAWYDENDMYHSGTCEEYYSAIDDYYDEEDEDEDDDEECDPFWDTCDDEDDDDEDEDNCTEAQDCPDLPSLWYWCEYTECTDEWGYTDC
jgi:hypothetical protein